MLIRKLVSYGKIGLYYLLHKRVGVPEYRDAYDRVSATYDCWTDRMGRHTDRILDPEVFPEATGTFRVLDLSCGTGYITGKLLRTLPDRYGNDFRITAVDLSERMIARCRTLASHDNVEYVRSEASAFLESAPESAFDAVLCGWGLVYLDRRTVIPAIHRVLKRDGVFAAIMNRRGTLSGIEDVFIDVMLEQPGTFGKVMDIRFNMPRDERAFSGWFTSQGFDALATGSGEEVCGFATPDGLLDWLTDTGAIAGTERIFSRFQSVRDSVLEKIARRCRSGTAYSVNHAYVYGLFRKRSS